MKYYIGVDGGGTKTAYALFDENKNCLKSVKTEGSNHENLEGSYTEAAQIIMKGITTLIGEAGLELSDISGILMGLAGMDHDYQHDILCGLLTEMGLRDFRIYNDGFIVTKAGSPDGTGIGYNCGTGTCCNSIASDGKMLQVGGFGELSGDMGNGMWIAMRTFRLVYDEICLKKRRTVLTPLLCKLFNVEGTRDGLLSLIARLEEQQGEFIMGLIDIFFEALNVGDESALELCEEMAQRGSDYIAAHTFLQSFEGETINVVLSGSIHTKLPSGVYIEMLKKYSREKSGRTLNFIILDTAPVTGCINWLLERKG